MFDTLKRILVGRPIASADLEHQRIPKTIGLAVFSSDAISSTAYATEEILFVTALGASSLALGLSKLVPIAIAVALLLAIVVTSYRRTIHAYPSGGGSYIVSRENLGRSASLVAGAAILVDYVLTVAVSISAGVAAIISIPQFHELERHRVAACLVAIALITVVNLRGVKESGRLFAVPTYVYIAAFGALLVWGLGRSFFAWGGGIDPIEFDPELFEGARQAGGALSLVVLLRGFSSGAVALTGIEAIADGVPAFRRPEARNAAITLTAMAVILGTLFFGSAVLAHRLAPMPSHDRTVIAQLGLHVFGEGPLFLLLQIATAVILLLAANTAYADFPRLSSIIARDGFLPRQFANRGDRLVFSNGVLFLAAMAALLIVVFRGITTLLIPLYAVGVFTSFTLSQAGMVRHQRREAAGRWTLGAATSAFGAFATFTVLCIVVVSKFNKGAWVPAVVIPVIVMLFRLVRSHYDAVRAELAVPIDYRAPRMNHTVVVLVSGVHRGVLHALAYARSLAPNRLIAVCVVSDSDEEERIAEQWARYRIDTPLEVVHSPYRELTRPVLAFIDELDATFTDDVVTVVLPEFVVRRWWEHLLHNQTALLLKGRLLFRKNTVVTSVPYHFRQRDG
jgi:amino acid transporter